MNRAVPILSKGKGQGYPHKHSLSWLPLSRLVQICNQSEDIRTRNAKLLCNCATAKSFGTELRDIFAMHVNVPRPAETHATDFRPRNTGVNALTDDFVFELSYRAKNVHLKPRCRVRPGGVDTLLGHHQRDVVSRELSDQSG